ncbi:MAG: UDP-2,3-diacylglucosamine hydrolase [Marinilabiliales bacterium]|nr:MAG: UDP-2,3-diacylglucosamine hydrolase [Marinilabiliales bacterium]
MDQNKKIYFASDVHLGLPDHEKSLKREKLFVQWLDEIKNDAHEIYLLGDIFDFWFEYKRAIPKGFSRFLGKLSEITDSGIPVHFFTGNHDMWIFDYLPKETGVILHKNPIIKDFSGKKFYLAHGDGLGPGDRSYKLLKRVFASRFSQWLFARFHPNLGIGIANLWSTHSRYSRETRPFEGEDKEWLILYSNDLLKKEHFDFLIYGHRHSPLDLRLNENSRYINLGDWLSHFTYAVFDGEEMYLKKYSKSIEQEQ